MHTRTSMSDTCMAKLYIDVYFCFVCFHATILLCGEIKLYVAYRHTAAESISQLSRARRRRLPLYREVQAGFAHQSREGAVCHRWSVQYSAADQPCPPPLFLSVRRPVFTLVRDAAISGDEPLCSRRSPDARYMYARFRGMNVCVCECVGALPGRPARSPSACEGVPIYRRIPDLQHTVCETAPPPPPPPSPPQLPLAPAAR